MQTKINVALAGFALSTFSSLAAVADEIPFEVAIKYDRTAPVGETYSQAHLVARKACQTDDWVFPMKRYLEETCVAPVVAQFVLQTENQDLIALYEAKMGEPPAAVTFVAD